MVDQVDRCPAAPFAPEGAARIEVAVDVGEVAAGNREAQAVCGRDYDGKRLHIDREAVGAVGRLAFLEEQVSTLKPQLATPNVAIGRVVIAGFADAADLVHQARQQVQAAIRAAEMRR